MTLLDLAVLLGLGAWLEWRGAPGAVRGKGRLMLVSLLAPAIVEIAGTAQLWDQLGMQAPLEFVLWVVAVLALIRTFERRPGLALGGSVQDAVPFALPAFPQGLVPLVWVYLALDFYWTRVASGADDPLPAARLPLIKMQLLVPASDLERARSVVQPESIKIA